MAASKVFLIKKHVNGKDFFEAYTSKKRVYNRLNELHHYFLVSYEQFSRKLDGFDYEYSIRFFTAPNYQGSEKGYTVRMLEVNVGSNVFD